MIFDPVLIRLFLIEAFDQLEFDLLCRQHFKDVYDRFDPEMTRGEQIQLLLDHCERFGRIPQLLAALENARPAQYKKRFQANVG